MSTDHGSKTEPLHSSPRRIFVQWANRVDPWVRSIASEVLVTRKQLTGEVLDEAYRRFQSEKGLIEGEPTAVDALVDEEDTSKEVESFRLESLSHRSGVNALAPLQEMAFSDRLTVVFGENATGKTGYSRILKQAAAVRSAEPILPDIHSTADGPPEAVISFTLGETADSLTWRGEAGLTPLNRMSIFDGRMSEIHIQDELTYHYTPRDLALFGATHATVDAIHEALKDEIDERTPDNNPFTTRFKQGTSVRQQIETLGPATELGELRNFANEAPTPEELEGFQEELSGLRERSSPAFGEAAARRRDLIAEAHQVAEAVNDFDPSEYVEALDTLATARTSAETVAASQFSDEDVPGGITEEWQAFVEAGEHYIGVVHSEEYPETGDQCIYCRQQLDEAALALVRRYREHVRSRARQAVQDAESTVARLAGKLTSVSSQKLEGLLSGFENDGDEPSDENESTSFEAFLSKTGRFLQALGAARMAVEEATLHEFEPLMELAARVKAEAGDRLPDIEARVAALRGEADERREAFEKRKREIAELQGWLDLKRLLPEIQQWVEEAKWCSRAEAVLKGFRGTKRSLTTSAKTASEQLLNQDFEALFLEECGRLDAPEVNLDFPGRKGEAARRKSLATEHPLGEVLSEGEQKVVALADFLAESRMRRGSAPVVFDDPVNSLDYRRIDEVARRIVELSQKHQTVVFTHNLWFASKLVGFADKRGVLVLRVAEHAGQPGFIEDGGELRGDTPKQIRARVERAISRAEEASGPEREDCIALAYGQMRAWIESVVEHDLLQGVVGRYRDNVMMGKLSEIKIERLGIARERLYERFEKCCRITAAHSQAVETLNVRPTLDELRNDWVDTKQVRKDYNAA